MPEPTAQAPVTAPASPPAQSSAQPSPETAPAGEEEKPNGAKTIIWIIAIVILLSILGIGGYFLWTRVLRPVNTTADQDETNTTPTLTGFRAICRNASEEYSSEELANQLIVWADWEDPQTLHYKLTPESEAQTRHISASEYGAYVQVIDDHTVGYSITGNDGSYSIHTLDLATGDDQELFSGTGADEYLENEYYLSEDRVAVVLVELPPEEPVEELTTQTVTIKIIDKSEDIEETLWSEEAWDVGGREGISTDSFKIAASPDQDYLYFIDTILYFPTDLADISDGVSQEDAMEIRIFDLNSMELADTITTATDPTWVGNNYILYRNSSTAYVYNVMTEESSVVSEIPEEALWLEYAPLNSGMIAYHTGTDYSTAAYIYNCVEDQVVAEKTHSFFDGFLNEETALHHELEYNPEGEEINYEIASTNYWSLEDNALTEIGATNLSTVTIWGKY